MNQTLQALLDEGREIIAAQERQKAEEEAAKRQKEADALLEMETAALELIPEAVRPFAKLRKENNDWLCIELPDAAVVERFVVCDYRGKVYFPELSRPNNWNVHRYKFDQEESDIFLWYDREFSELPAALAYAVEAGDGKAEAEARAARLREANTKPSPPPMLLCPLLKKNCHEEKCAWWLSGLSGCSVTAILDLMPTNS